MDDLNLKTISSAEILRMDFGFCYRQVPAPTDAATQAFLTWIEMVREQSKIFVATLPSFNSVKLLPKKSGVYFLVDEKVANGDKFLYIGKSINIQARWKSRQDFKLGGSSVLFCFFLDDAYYELEVVEAFFISVLHPIYNRRMY